MPLLSKKAFARPSAKHAKSTFKSPINYKENISRLLNDNAPKPALEVSSQIYAKKKNTSPIKHVSLTPSSSVSLTPSSSSANLTSSSVSLTPSSSSANLTSSSVSLTNSSVSLTSSITQLPTKSSNIVNNGPLFDTPTSSSHYDSDVESIILSKEILNRKDIKDKYVEFWNNNLTPEMEEEFKSLSQEFKPKEKKEKNNKNLNSKTKKKTANTEKLKDSKTKREPRKATLSQNADEKNNEPEKGSKKMEKVTRKTGKTSKKMEKGSKKTEKESNKMDLLTKMSLIHESRNTGLYVLCDNCDKHRYLPDVKDPLELPETWFCWMNPDTEHNTCNAEEEPIDPEEEEYLITNLYNSGSIVWAKMEGYPWWPAMVEDDPDVEDYFWLEDTLEPTHYHVTFFDSLEVTRAWIKTADLKPFARNVNNPQFRVAKFDKYSARIDASIQQAKDAIDLPLIDRLKKYSFIYRYEKTVRIRKPTKRTKSTVTCDKRKSDVGSKTNKQAKKQKLNLDEFTVSFGSNHHDLI